MNEVRIEQGKPVTNVSVHQIAEPAILHSDQPSLIADPPDHTPPRPTPNSPPPSRTYRLTLRVPRLSERKRRRDDMCKWKRETEAKIKSKRTPKQTKSEGTHEGTHTSRSTAAQKTSRGNAYNKGRQPICPPQATRRMLLHEHTRTHMRRSRQQKQHRKNDHVVEVGGGLGPRRRRTVGARQRQVNCGPHTPADNVGRVCHQFSP